jgi:hypothetical protein
LRHPVRAAMLRGFRRVVHRSRKMAHCFVLRASRELAPGRIWRSAAPGCFARVVKLVYTQRSERCGRKAVRVRVPPRACPPAGTHSYCHPARALRAPPARPSAGAPTTTLQSGLARLFRESADRCARARSARRAADRRGARCPGRRRSSAAASPRSDGCYSCVTPRSAPPRRDG